MEGTDERLLGASSPSWVSCLAFPCFLIHSENQRLINLEDSRTREARFSEGTPTKIDARKQMNGDKYNRRRQSHGADKNKLNGVKKNRKRSLAGSNM